MFQKDVFDLLFNTILQGVIVVDDKHKIVACNSAASEMFGYTKNELLNKPLNTLIPNKNQSTHEKEAKKFIKERESRKMGKGRDLYGVHKNSKEFPVEIGLNFFQVYNKDYVMALIVDISYRKSQEQKLLDLNVSLEKQVENRTQELKTVIDELKKVNYSLDEENRKRTKAEKKVKQALKKEINLNELKTKFLSMVSHEFKTPLSGILTSAMLLSKYKLEEQQQKRDRHIKTITDKVHYLNNILNDFLSIEKLEKGKVNYTNSTFEVSKVVNEVVYGANLLLKEGQKINYPINIDHISLYQDEKIVELALSNLVHNAIKYSSERNTINIDIKQDNSFTTFIISDNGIGIPKKDQKNIFNRYFRAENVLLIQGTGIGLNIVKHHLENLGGSISFVSKENKGSTFTFKIPNKATNEQSIIN